VSRNLPKGEVLASNLADTHSVGVHRPQEGRRAQQLPGRRSPRMPGRFQRHHLDQHHER